MVVAQYGPAEYLLNRSIAVSRQEVAGLASEAQQALLKKGWPEAAASAVQLLVMEHGVNIVDHAHTQPDSRITLQLRLSDRQAYLLFRDFGREWNFQAKLDASQHREIDSFRGRGLHIIRTIAKHIDMVRYNRENIVRYVVSRFFEVSPVVENRSVTHE